MCSILYTYIISAFLVVTFLYFFLFRCVGSYLIMIPFRDLKQFQSETSKRNGNK